MKANNHVSHSHRQSQPAFIAAIDAFGSAPHEKHGKPQYAARPQGERQPSFAAALDNF